MSDLPVAHPSVGRLSQQVSPVAPAPANGVRVADGLRVQAVLGRAETPAAPRMPSTVVNKPQQPAAVRSHDMLPPNRQPEVERALPGDEVAKVDVTNSAAVTIGKSGYKTVDEFSGAVTTKYQSLYDQGYARAKSMADRGLIPNSARSIGSETDNFARVGLRDWLENVEGIQEGVGSIIQVNRRLYDPMGSGAYRVPDVYIPGANTILDGSLSFKTGSTRQVIDFGKYSGGAKTTIIAPSGLQRGSYGIFP